MTNEEALAWCVDNHAKVDFGYSVGPEVAVRSTGHRQPARGSTFAEAVAKHAEIVERRRKEAGITR